MPRDFNSPEEEERYRNFRDPTAIFIINAVGGFLGGTIGGGIGAAMFEANGHPVNEVKWVLGPAVLMGLGNGILQVIRDRRNNPLF